MAATYPPEGALIASGTAPEKHSVHLPPRESSPALRTTGDPALRGSAPVLGKRQQNLLTAILRGVPVVRGGASAPLPLPEIQAALSQFRPPAPYEADGLANRLRPRLLDAMVGAEARRAGYIQGLPAAGLPQLLSAGSYGTKLPIVLRIVYGATCRLPLRAVSYVLPAVQMAERIARATGRFPHLEIVSISSLGARINMLPERGVAAEADLLVRALARLLPALGMEGRFGIVTHRPVDVSGALSALVAGLTSAGRAQVLDVLAGRGSSGSAEQTLSYAAAHVLLHDLDTVPLDVVHGHAAPEGAVRIDVGGIQERHFHQVRTLFALERATTLSSPLLLSRHSVPPYMMARGGDIGLREFLQGTAPDPAALPLAVQHDLRYLDAHMPAAYLRSELGGARLPGP